MPAPTNLVAPSLHVVVVVGKSAPVYVNSWTGVVSFTYQWQRSDFANGSGAENISGETSDSYTPPGGDFDKYISCAVTGINGDGETTVATVFTQCLAAGSEVAETIVEFSLADLASFNGKFLLDGDEWNDEAPQNTVDWSWMATSAGGGSLIAPSFAVTALHVGVTSLTFITPSNQEEARTVAESWDIHRDLRLVRLNAPITTIEPIAIFADSRVLVGQEVLAIEDDHHLNVMIVSDNHSNAIGTLLTPTSEDIIEGGDSGHPAVAVLGVRPILAMTAFFSHLGGPNPSTYIAEFAAILALYGEQLSLVTPLPGRADSIRDRNGNQISAGGQIIRLG